MRRHQQPHRSMHIQNKMKYQQMKFNQSTPEAKYYQNTRVQKKKSHELIFNSQINLNKNLRRVTNPVNKSTCVK